MSALWHIVVFDDSVAPIRADICRSDVASTDAEVAMSGRENSSRHQGRSHERNVADGLLRAHHLVDVRHTSRCWQRCLVDRRHVHIGAIEHGEAGIPSLEREEEVGPAEQNDLGALLSA
jgi:hypothetical protein